MASCRNIPPSLALLVPVHNKFTEQLASFVCENMYSQVTHKDHLNSGRKCTVHLRFYSCTQLTLDRKRSSFFPQSHARQAKKRRRLIFLRSGFRPRSSRPLTRALDPLRLKRKIRDCSQSKLIPSVMPVLLVIHCHEPHYVYNVSLIVF